VTTLGALVGAPRASIVSFWATWCAPCAMEGRELAKIRRKFADERLAIVGINLDAAPDAAKLAAFRQKAQMNYIQGLAGQRVYAALAGTERVALPRTYVFDGQGRPVAAFGRYFGARTLKAINDAVATAMRG
jgi:thiol-disulfide isomerase/thioredoxin